MSDDFWDRVCGIVGYSLWTKYCYNQYVELDRQFNGKLHSGVEEFKAKLSTSLANLCDNKFKYLLSCKVKIFGGTWIFPLLKATVFFLHLK